MPAVLPVTSQTWGGMLMVIRERLFSLSLLVLDTLSSLAL